jgi:hydrogenase maturation factor
MTLGLDPLKLMSSGTLLLAVERSKRWTVQRALLNTSFKLTEVGKLTPRSKGRVLVRRGRRQALRAVSQDELYKLT